MAYDGLEFSIGSRRTPRRSSTPTSVPGISSPIPPAPGLSEPRRALSPWTAGGEVDIKIPDITHSHYAQEDAELNGEIWALFPVDKTEVEIGREVDALHRALAQKEPGIAHYNRPILRNGIKTYEQLTLATALLSLCEIHRGLTLRARKAAKNVSGLQDMVAVATLRKADGDALLEGGDTWAAIQEYYEALLSLYPWVPTRLLFSAEDAFTTGLAELYSGLWLQLATASKDRDRVLTARNITTFNWLVVVYQAASVVTNLCFVDRYTLSTAFALLAETNTLFSATISSVEVYSAHAFTEAALDAKESARCQACLARLIRASHDEHQADLGIKWAHAACLDVHSGCGCSHEAVRALLRSQL